MFKKGPKEGKKCKQKESKNKQPGGMKRPKDRKEKRKEKTQRTKTNLKQKRRSNKLKKKTIEQHRPKVWKGPKKI